MAHALVALDEVSRVTDQELITRLRRLVRDDQVLCARLVVHIGEVDARGLYREHAYSSMFTYCIEELRMSEAQAYLRIQAARLGRQFPRVLQLLAEGALHLTALRLIGPHLTADNHVDLLERACGKRKREVERLVAEIAPKPDVPNRMRKLPEPSAARATRAEAQSAQTSLEARQASTVATQTLNARPEACDPMRGQPSLESSTVAPSRAASDVPVDGARESNAALFALEAPRQRGSSKPLSPGRYKVELTAGQALHDKLAQLQDLLRHQVPDGDLAVIVERAVDLLIDDTLKQRFAQTRAHARKKPRSAKRPAGACDPSRRHAGATDVPSFETPTRGATGACDTSRGNAVATEAPSSESPAGWATGACAPSRGNAVAPEAPSFESPTGWATGACAPTRGNAVAPEAPSFESLTGWATGACAPSRGNAVAPEAPSFASPTGWATGACAPSRGNAVAPEAPSFASPTGWAAGACAPSRGNAVAPEAPSFASPAGGPKRPRNANSRYIPRAVVREVYQRDAGQCTFVSAEGKRCSERGFLELHHHDQPYARGGQPTVENLRLVCRTHNEKRFGVAHPTPVHDAA